MKKIGLFKIDEMKETYSTSGNRSKATHEKREEHFLTHRSREKHILRLIKLRTVGDI